MNAADSVNFAKKYLEDILSFFGVNAEVEVRSTTEVIELAVPSVELSGFLIGHRGETLRSLQHLVSSALRNANAETSRVSIDIADYKRQRADRLSKDVEGWAASVIEDGEELHLKPMNAADRRIVHQAISKYDGLTTYSEGEGRDRHIVITKS